MLEGVSHALQRGLRQGIIVLLLSLLVGQLGCVTSKPVGPLEDIRAQFGTIGVVTTPFDADSALQHLPKGVLAEAWRGAGTGALRVADMFDGMPRRGPPEVSAVILALMLALLPPSVALGAVEGAMNAESEESFEQTQTVLRQALATLNNQIQETLQDHFLRKTRARTNYPLVILGSGILSEEGEIIDSRALAIRHIDTLLQLSIESVELVGGLMHHPNFALAIAAHVTVTRVEDGEVLYDAVFPYEDPLDYPLKEWAAKDAELFAKEWGNGINDLASLIARELFTRYRFP